ncbi:MAG TPA: 2-oxoacid:acceptor oxidoreductase family protein [Bacillota bacterium]|nr:2-oxoacid:acceptor oxidoreductase family protein [Bacillota bacterium]
MSLAVVMAGFGGQGVMLMGQLLTYAGMIENKQVSWMPSYGPEMRGGTANCTVILSDQEVGSPVVTNPDVVIAMNLPSMDKFEKLLVPGGTLIYNSTLINRAPQRQDIKVIAVPANEVAQELGNTRVANMVALGAFVQATGAVGDDSIAAALKKALPAHRQDLLPLNMQAIEKGRSFAR